ncbi:MAG: hypothetical protein H6876_10975 [Hyphomicrobiaceae bacterium]|nr:hypothetical protein [Hyphomicrobiaceae bacterium]MCC0008625.1 hypothetical protein [Hyphomicrobiaceae bacterium]
MVIFSSTAVAVQAIKIAIFFMTLGLPSTPASTAEAHQTAPVAAFHEVERPHSNPRRQR